MATGIRSLDLGTLSTYYASGGGQSDRLRTESLRQQGVGSDSAATILPPWALNIAQPADTALERIFSSRPLIDRNDPFVQVTGGNDAFRDLFALYRGLSRAREVVSYLETTPGAEARRGLLDKRLQGFLDEIRGYADGLKLDGATLASGVRASSVASSLRLPKPVAATSPEHLGAAVATTRDQAIPGLTGSESFTVSVTNGAGTTDVAIDLALMAETRSVDNVAAYINARLTAAGAQSVFQVERYSEFSYGFRVQQAAGESIAFASDPGDGAPSLYLAGRSGTGQVADGFLAKLDGLDGAGPAETFRRNIDSGKEDRTGGVAVDSRGFAYVVGTAGGSLGGQANVAGNDVFLRKYDAAGQLVWSRLLGATADSSGLAVAVDAADNVVVAGRTRAQLTELSHGGGNDAFVTKFSGDGAELWTRQAQPFADDAALALATDAAGNIYLSGYTAGPLDDAAMQAGGRDAFVQTLDGSGNLAGVRQFGSAGDDRASAVAVDFMGNVFVAAEVDGRATVRKYAFDNATQTPDWEADLGSLAGGAVSGIAVGNGGAVYVTGRTANAALGGSIVAAHAGGEDGFVTRLTDGGSAAAVDWTRYMGDAGADEVAAIAVRDAGGSDEIYVAGSVVGWLGGGAQVGEQDGFAARLDAAGSLAWSEQIGGGFAHGIAGLAVAERGSTALSRLGLPEGSFVAEPLQKVTDLTSARAGQSFSLSVDGGATRRIAIEAGDSLGFLAFKINKALGGAGRATIESGPDGRFLKISAGSDKRIDIAAGPEGKDALKSLGLAPATLFPEQPKDEKGLRKDDGIFALGLLDGLGVKDRRATADAGVVLDDAMRLVRKAYQWLVGESPQDNLLTGLGQIQPNELAKLQNLRRTLDVVTSLAQQPATSFNLSV